jgi:hypothetical protein
MAWLIAFLVLYLVLRLLPGWVWLAALVCLALKAA